MPKASRLNTPPKYNHRTMGEMGYAFSFGQPVPEEYIKRLEVPNALR